MIVYAGGDSSRNFSQKRDVTDPAFLSRFEAAARRRLNL